MYGTYIKGHPEDTEKIDENTEERENASPLLVSSAVPLVDQKVRIPC